jgi:outer membrane protein OmpA-like peptidoglycan-associated protein
MIDMSRAWWVAAAVGALFLCVSALAGEDVAGAKDHPMLTRWPGSYITDYQKNYDSAEFLVASEGGGEPERRRVEGDATSLRYFYESAETQPSPLQVIRNYQNAVKAIGGTVVYERLPKEGDGGETTLNVSGNGKDIWVKVLPDIYAAPTQCYQLIVVEAAAMTQVVSANKLWDDLSKNGFVTLYINFDTGKSDLKEDGVKAVGEIVKVLEQNPSLAISIEGHTDNVGGAASNKQLSEDRAKSVMNAVIAGGIDASRLSAIGYGQESPIADNRTEEGRAKNRRVELVKK